MKQTASFHSLILILFLLALMLTACERPLQEAVDDAVGATATLNPAPLGGEGPTLIVTPPLASPIPLTVEPVPGTDQQPTPAVDQPLEQPAATPLPETTIPTEDVIYTVVAGDTMGKIAERYGISVERIAAANEISNINTLEVGQQLLIPLSGESEPPVGDTPAPAAGQEQIHIVQAGETLYRIGQRYGFTIEELTTYNNLTNPDRLEVGQQIRIPPEG